MESATKRSRSHIVDMKTVKKLFYIISNFLSVINNISHSPFCKLSNKHHKHDINI